MSPSTAGSDNPLDPDSGSNSSGFRRLRSAIMPPRCPYMTIFQDHTKARSPQVGMLIHEAIGTIASQTLAPSSGQHMAMADQCVSRFPKIEGRAHRQNIAAATSAYFTWLLPPATWLFHGAEVHLGHGRLDLLWVDFNDRILIDEVKSGHSRNLHLSRTQAQVDGYRACAVATWGTRFVGIRLLCTADPRASLLITPDGTPEPLFSTPFVRAA